jgi:hypothetical protein
MSPSHCSTPPRVVRLICGLLAAPTILQYCTASTINKPVTGTGDPVQKNPFQQEQIENPLQDQQTLVAKSSLQENLIFPKSEDNLKSKPPQPLKLQKSDLKYTWVLIDNKLVPNDDQNLDVRIFLRSLQGLLARSYYECLSFGKTNSLRSEGDGDQVEERKMQDENQSQGSDEKMKEENDSQLQEEGDNINQNSFEIRSEQDQTTMPKRCLDMYQKSQRNFTKKEGEDFEGMQTQGKEKDEKDRQIQTPEQFLSTFYQTLLTEENVLLYFGDNLSLSPPYFAKDKWLPSVDKFYKNQVNLNPTHAITTQQALNTFILKTLDRAQGGFLPEVASGYVLIDATKQDSVMAGITYAAGENRMINVNLLGYYNINLLG